MRSVSRVLRSLARQPVASLAAIGILALGLGIGTALFGAARALLWEPLPITEPHELVALFSHSEEGGYGYLSLPDVRDLGASSRALEGLAAYTDVDVALGDGGTTTRVRAQLVTANYFEVLEVAARGRVFTADDLFDVPRVVLANGLWRRRFGSDPTLIGRSVTINGTPFTVLGVAPSDFTGTDPATPAEAWIPMDLHRVVMPGFAPELVENRETQWLVGIGRRRANASLIAARQELSAIFAHGHERPRESGMVWRLAVVPARAGALWPPDREATIRWVRLSATGASLLLLIVTANVSALLLARTSARRTELALRQTLGARVASILHLVLLDALVLTLAGAVAALPVALVVLRLLQATPVLDQKAALGFSLDPSILAFAALVAVGTGLLSAVAPAVTVLRSRLGAALSEAAAGAVTGRSHTRAHRCFSVVQVALAVFLLSANALLLAAYSRLADTDLGFSANRVLLASVDPGLSGLREQTWTTVYERLYDRISAVPGVEQASVAFPEPFGDWRLSRSLVVPGRTLEPEGYSDVVAGKLVSPGYFRTLGIPQLAGRDFTPRDRLGASAVAIVSRSLGDRLWPEGPALGRRFDLWGSAGDHLPVEVVGVVADTRQGRSVTEEPGPHLYLPLFQHPTGSATVLARSRGGVAGLAPALRSAIDETMPGLAVFDERLFEEHIARSLRRPRSASLVLTGLGGLALVLSVAGLYGLLSYLWTQRGREIGLRMAIGATRGDILRLVIRQGLGLTAVGIVIGLLPAPFLSRWLSPWLEAQGALDPVLLVAVAGMVAAGGLAGALLPALRASRVDPLSSLRQL